jgi:hypothetical protein
MISCVSFKVQPPPDPENQIEALVLCSQITQKEELLYPGEPMTEFKPGAGPIYCYVRLADVSQTIRLMWKWYTPDGHLHRETKEVTVNRDSVYLEAVTAYDHAEITPEEHEEGRWAVVVLLDGQLIGRLTFQLVDN